MIDRPVNPAKVAFFSLNPTGALLVNPGSWGGTVAMTTPARVFAVTLSPEFAGGIVIGDIGKQLHITVSLKESASVTIAIAPAANGFIITFGADLAVAFTVKVEKLVAE